mgnify:FL=1
MSKEVIEKVIQDKKSFVYISAIILKHTNNIANIHVSHNDRKHGNSNYNLIKLSKLFFKIYIYYANIPILKLFRSKKEQYIIKDKIGFN